MRRRSKVHDHTTNDYVRQQPDPGQYATRAVYQEPTRSSEYNRYHSTNDRADDHVPQSHSEHSDYPYQNQYNGELPSHHPEETGRNLQSPVHTPPAGHSGNPENYLSNHQDRPEDGRTHRRRRVINVMFYKTDPYEGKVPRGEGWVIEPIDGGFRAIKDERALNGWMHIYERAKVIHPSGNSGKTYWYFESIFDPPERVRHIREKFSKDGVQVQDLTPSDSGYFSHIKFDFDHARKAWRDVLPVLPTHDETLKEVMDREKAERSRRMRAYGSYYRESEPPNPQYSNTDPTRKDFHIAEQRAELPPNPHRKHRSDFNVEELNGEYGSDGSNRRGTFSSKKHYAQQGPENRGAKYNQENAYSHNSPTQIDRSRPNVLDISHLVKDLQETTANSDVYSDESSAPWDHRHGSIVYRKAQDETPINYWQQQQGLYNDNRRNPASNGRQHLNTGFIFPQENRKNDYSFKKEYLPPSKNGQSLQRKPGEVWVLRVYGFGYTDDTVPLNDLLQFDLGQIIGDTSEKYNSYIDSYDKNAVNIALEDDSMSHKELERAIQELIEFVISRDTGARFGHAPHNETTLYNTNKKDTDPKTDSFNDDRSIYIRKRRLSTKVKPKKVRSSRYRNWNFRYRHSYGQNDRYPRTKLTKYKTNGDYLEKGNQRHKHDEPIAARVRTRKYTRRGNNLDDGSITANMDSSSVKDNTDEFEKLDKTSFHEDMNSDSNDENQKPFDVVYINKKVVTIEETADGEKRRKFNDVTQAKRIARTKAKRYPSYLSHLPIPASIKHRIGKRSALDNGN